MLHKYSTACILAAQNISAVSFIIHSHFTCVTQFFLFMRCLGSIHHHMSETELNRAKQLRWWQKPLIFLMSRAPSSIAYHSESDTFIINNTQTARWHRFQPEVGSGWCRESYVAWLHREPYWLPLMFLLNQSPSPIGYFLHLERWMMEMTGFMHGAHQWHCIDFIRRLSIVSVTSQLANGRRHLTLHHPSSSLATPSGNLETTFTLSD